jgi:hypothetical protein
MSSHIYHVMYILTNTFCNQLIRLFTDTAFADKNGSTTRKEFFFQIAPDSSESQLSVLRSGCVPTRDPPNLPNE